MSDLTDEQLEQEFENAVKKVQGLPKSGPYTPTNDEKLKFYSLYKQATEGPCNTTRPGMLDFVGKAKWDAWKALGDMDKKEAKRGYVQALREMEEKMKGLGLA